MSPCWSLCDTSSARKQAASSMATNGHNQFDHLSVLTPYESLRRRVTRWRYIILLAVKGRYADFSARYQPMEMELVSQSQKVGLIITVDQDLPPRIGHRLIMLRLLPLSILVSFNLWMTSRTCFLVDVRMAIAPLLLLKVHQFRPWE